MSESKRVPVAELSQIVGTRHVLKDEALDNLEIGYDPDNLSAGVMVRPCSTQEVSAVVALCQSHGIAVVPQGGRTGLSGGAASRSGQVILELSRMSQIERIDPLAGVAVVKAGATLQGVEEASRAHGLSAGIDLAARGTATIGGMVSTNAGGMEAFRNGSMRNRVIGLEVVLASGDVLDDMTEVGKCNEGYDLKQLFCGAEGTLGIVTRAVLRLEPAPRAPATLLLACNTATEALRIMRACQTSADLDLLHAEVMWRAAARRIAAETGLSAVLSFCDANVYVILEVVCRSVATSPEEAFLEAVERHGLEEAMLDAVLAKNERERRDIWNIRENSAAVDAKLAHSLWFDVSVPLGHLDEYVAKVEDKIGILDPDLQVYVLGHLGDGNLHYSIGKGEQMRKGMQSAIVDAIYGDLKLIGGAFSAEHGIGTEKRESLQKLAGTAKLNLMADIKRAFDPAGIMNPGKVL